MTIFEKKYKKYIVICQNISPHPACEGISYLIPGGGLSLVGIMMQAMTKNSLADPYILGISSGASTGATCVLLLGSLPLIGEATVQFGAFLGAMVSALVVFVLAGTSGRFNSTTLVLSGTAVSAIFSAFTNLLIFLSPDKRKVNSALF